MYVCVYIYIYIYTYTHTDTISGPMVAGESAITVATRLPLDAGGLARVSRGGFRRRAPRESGDNNINNIL